MSNDPENGKVIESVSMADLAQKRSSIRRTPAFLRAMRRCWLSCGFAACIAFVAGTALMKMKQPLEFLSMALTSALETRQLDTISIFLLLASGVILAAAARFIFCLLDEMKN